MMAAAASAALDNALPQLPRVHALTMATAKSLEDLGYIFALPVQSNMIVVDLKASGVPPAAFVDYCKAFQVAVFPSGRLVFHIQTSQDGVSRLVQALKDLMSDKVAGKELSTRKVSGGYT